MHAHRQTGRKDALVPSERAVTDPAGRYLGRPRTELGKHSPRLGSMASDRRSRSVRLWLGAGG